MDEPSANPEKPGANVTRDGERRRSAASWFVRRQEGLSSDAVGDYADWIADDPAHAKALAEASDAWDAVGRMGSTPEITALRRAALANASAARLRNRLTTRRMMGGAIAAGVVGLAVFLTAALLPRTPQPQVFETTDGERSVVTLADHSKVSLDEGTRISVSFSSRGRQVDLIRGQAEFEVAKDPGRPFSVVAAERRVTATGTVFNVDMAQRELIVTLIEGHVIVAKAGARPDARDSVALNPSEKLVVDRVTGAAVKTGADASEALAWRQGKLVFDGEPLGRAVERVNRYADRKIALSGAGETGRVSGVFDMGDSAAFAEAVASQLPFDVRVDSGQEIQLVAQ